MLPSWMNDLAIVVTLVTGIPVIIGCVLGWFARPSRGGPSRRQHITLLGAFKTGMLNGIIRPDIPISTEVVRAVLATFILPIATILYMNGDDTIYNTPFYPLLVLLLYAICFYVVFLILVWARLLWKKDYMNRMSAMTNLRGLPDAHRPDPQHQTLLQGADHADPVRRLDGAARWGRRGSPGTVRLDTYRHRADADAAERRSVRRRLRDGYTRLSEVPPRPGSQPKSLLCDRPIRRL
jgi:hypothetical protein